MPMTSFISVLWSPTPVYRVAGAALDGLRPWQPQQVSPHHKEIRQGAGDEQPVGILEQSAIAGLHETEDSLDHQKRMFALGAHSRLRGVLGLLFRGQRVAARAFLVGEVFRVRGAATDYVRLPGIGAIAPHPRLRPVQQIGQDSGVVHVRGGRDHRVNELGLAVHPHVRLHPEIPLIALLGLVHLGVARSFPVLRRGGCLDDRGIDDGAAAHGETAGMQVPLDESEDSFAEAVRLQQVAELAHRGLVGRALAPQVDAHEGAHGARVVERFFDGGVREVEPLLQEVDPQHPLQPHGRTPGAVVLGVKRFDQRTQLAPRHHAIHVGEKLLAAGWFVIGFETGFGEGGLLGTHRWNLYGLLFDVR